MKYDLPKLPYDYNALEPYIDAQTMEIHHSKHHGGYVNKLNAALEKHSEIQEKPLKDMIRSLKDVPEDIRKAVRNNGGGHLNHSLFWEIMTKGGAQPDDEMKKSIEENFGSFDKFKEEFSTTAATIFGSGWAWLVKEGDALKITTTPNQDTPLMEGLEPILGLDVWEHAYYLKYQNKRPEYIEAWWNVVNWPAVKEHYKS